MSINERKCDQILYYIYDISIKGLTHDFPYSIQHHTKKDRESYIFLLNSGLDIYLKNAPV